MWNGFWCYRYLLWNLVSRDFKLKYRRSVLGVVWSVLNPLLMCLVYWAVFSSLMDMRGSGIDNFAVFLMCGQLLFNFFNEATSTGMSSVLGAAPLLKKGVYPQVYLPAGKVLLCHGELRVQLCSAAAGHDLYRCTLPPDPHRGGLPVGDAVLLQSGRGPASGSGYRVLPGYHAHLERVHHRIAVFFPPSSTTPPR